LNWSASVHGIAFFLLALTVLMLGLFSSFRRSFGVLTPKRILIELSHFNANLLQQLILERVFAQGMAT
jgi:membrane-associated HD superfamily phosphohydrolase